VNLLTGVVVGVVAAIIWALLVLAHRWWRRRQNFKHLAGTYRVTRKSTSERQLETVALTVRGNLLQVEYEGLENEGIASGEIVMNEQLPSSGRGHYRHDTPGKARGWGFYDVQVIADGTILVHSTFSDASERAALVGWEWTPRDRLDVPSGPGNGGNDVPVPPAQRRRRRSRRSDLRGDDQAG